MSVDLKDSKTVEDEIVRMLSGFSQMHLPSMMDELNRWHPPIDVMETEDRLVIIAEIAGISPSDVSITQEENVLTIIGSRCEVLPHTSPLFHHMEVNYGPFERNIRLPQKFIGGKITALYRDGFLRIEVEKQENFDRRIEIL